MARRVLALVAAVVMVLVAVAARNRIDNGDGGGGGGPLRLACASELRAVCDALDDSDEVVATIESALATADRLRAVERDDADVDGWLAPGPWGDIVNASRAASATRLFADAGDPLARSPFVFVVWKDKRAQLGCADPVDLGCVGDAVITRGFRLGMAADDQAEGLLADAALGAAHIKNANFASNDLGETDLADWITGVDANVDRVTRNPGARSFNELLTFRAAAADGFLSTEAAIGPQFARAALRAQLDFAFVVPSSSADVLFAPVDNARGERLARVMRSERVRALLRDSGWRVAGLEPIAGVSTTPRLGADDGLPSGGVLQALREVTK